MKILVDMLYRTGYTIELSKMNTGKISVGGSDLIGHRHCVRNSCKGRSQKPRVCISGENRGWTGPVALLRGCAAGRFPERAQLDFLMAEQRTENENQEYEGNS
jgi:hypothetical protein